MHTTIRAAYNSGSKPILGKPTVDFTWGNLPRPHMLAFNSLRSRAEEVGLHFERQLGGKLGYFASFRTCG